MDDVRAPAKRETIPLALWAIALLALSPFPVTAVIYGYGPAERMAPALSALLEWSAVVLSFLGGVRWGLETREPEPRAMRQVFSAMCAVAGWVILMSRGRAPDTPSRYPMLSTAVTTAACVSLAMCLEKAMHA